MAVSRLIGSRSQSAPVGGGPSDGTSLKPGRWRATAPAYAETMAQGSATRSGALAWAALGLLATPCSALELTRRFESEEASVAAARATELLDELVALGLARIKEAG